LATNIQKRGDKEPPIDAATSQLRGGHRPVSANATETIPVKMIALASICASKYLNVAFINRILFALHGLGNQYAAHKTAFPPESYA
jgi:hypothetical protein